MKELFGIPMGTLGVVLVAALVAALSAVAVVAAAKSHLPAAGRAQRRRRRGRSALIVVGLMLGTAIIAAALATGDTMSADDPFLGGVVARPDRRARVRAGCDADGRRAERCCDRRRGTSRRPTVADVRRAAAGSPLVDGVAPGDHRDVAVQAPDSRQTEPQVALFAPDGTAMRGFGAIRAPTAARFRCRRWLRAGCT